MLLSVVIPTRNRCNDLKRLLEALCRQTISADELEIIVYDNGSTDGTAFICEEYRNKIRNFIYHYDENPGLHRGRNYGYQNARGDVIVYYDDDVVPMYDTCLERIAEVFADDETGMVVGSIIPKFSSKPPKWMYNIWQKNGIYNTLIDYSCVQILAHDGDYVSPYYAFGANFIIRRSILDDTRGFHPDGMPDNLLMYRGDGETYVAQVIDSRNYKVVYCDGVSVHHYIGESRMTWDYICKVGFRTGITIAYTSLRRGEKPCLYRVPIIGNKYLRVRVMSINRGIRWLMKYYRLDTNVKNWIHKEDYLDDNGRIPILDG